MEWTVNEVLRDNITKLDYTLVPPGFRGDVRAQRSMQEWLVRVIDAIGEQSTKAQGLHKVITSADKLRHAPNHSLYLIKDADAKNGAGEVVGMLKMGPKHLFMWDEAGKVQEAEPMCVLDFYVLHGRQRAGLGTALFNFMLQDMNTTVERLAIDGPSPKMEAFLARNYNLTRLVRQANNFAVAPSFFAKSHGYASDREENLIKQRRNQSKSTQLVGRFAAPKPASAIGSVIHGPDTTAPYEFANGGSKAPSPSAVPVTPPEPQAEAKPEPALVIPTPAPSREPTPSPGSVPATPAAGLATPAAGLATPAAGAVPARPATLSVGTPASGEVSPARRDSQLTDRGYFDVKFYHNKLW